MTTFLTNVTAIVDAAIDWIGIYISTITSIPLLLFFFTFPLVGYGINLLKRLIRM